VLLVSIKGNIAEKLYMCSTKLNVNGLEHGHSVKNKIAKNRLVPTFKEKLNEGVTHRFHIRNMSNPHKVCGL